MPTAPNTETYTQKRQLSNGNADGQVIGQSGSDKIAFYGMVPLAQRQCTEIVGTGGANVVTSTYSTAGGTTAYSALTAFSSQIGNWATTSASVSGASSSWYATGYNVNNSLITASATSANSLMFNVLGELCKTMVALGFWKSGV